VHLPAAVEMREEVSPSITFTFSSYVEMALSLQVLCDPDRHGVLLPWVVRFKEKISPEAYDDIMTYGEMLGGWSRAITPVLSSPANKDLSVPGVLHELEKWPAAHFLAELGHDSQQWRDYLRFMWVYWTEYFHEEFYWIEPLLVSSIRQQAGKAGREGSGFLSTVAPNVARQVANAQVASSNGVGVRLLPSVFSVADQLVATHNGTITACYPVSPGIYRRPENVAPPEPLARLLKTLADETRLKILKLILEERKCARDLAEALELAEPTISRHLRRLRDTELVDTFEDGNFIYYTAKLERIAELHMKVLDFLRS
jgi:DNA-binding transcriptional ArsR family regulator